MGYLVRQNRRLCYASLYRFILYTLMRFHQFRLLLLCVTVLFISCESSITRSNNADDIERAKEYAARFYVLIHQQDFEQASKLFDSSISPTEGLKLIQAAKEMRGSIIDAVTDQVGTKVTTVNGTLSHVQYSIELNCVYEQGKTRETIIVDGSNFDNVQISGYHFTLK